MMTALNPLPLVLYANKDQHLTLQLEQIFQREGFRVESVADGNETLARARRLTPALLILDTELPGLGGLEVLRLLRGSDDTANIPAIILSSQPRRASDNDRGLSLGADDWLNKPFSPRELLERARNKMRSGQLQADLQQRTSELEALLRASEQLNRVKSVRELLELMPKLTLELLPGSLVAMGCLDEHGVLGAHRIYHKDSRSLPAETVAALLALLQGERHSRILNGEPGLPQGWSGGMIAVLQHGDAAQASTMVASPEVLYHSRHLHLLEGIGQQAVLALHDAQLHEMLTQQNTKLEETVRERSAELVSAQNMLIRSEKLATIGHLAAGLAHEINNPLQPIRILLDDMLEDLEAGLLPDAEDVVRIQESITRITRTVGQLLGFARRDREDSAFSRVDPGEILSDVIRLNRKLYKQKGFNLEVDLPQLPAICGNRDQLEQVFMNLLLNAWSAMSQGDSLTLEAMKWKGSVEIRIRDSGKGIPPEHIKEIFEPYFTTRENGRGLGLFISYSIIQNHRGTIEVQSTVGKGSTFTVRLPLATDTCEQFTQPTASQEA